MALSRTIIKLAWITRLPLWWIAFCDWIIEGEKTRWARFHRQRQRFLLALIHSAALLIHFKGRRAHEVTVATGLSAPLFESVGLSGQLVIFWQSVGREVGQSLLLLSPGH